MKLSEFISKLNLAHDVPNYYNSKFPYNCGYFNGSKFSFDCWNLIKAILGGWTDNYTKGYYVSPKNFPTGDCDGYHLLMQCVDRSRDFSQLKRPGTYLYISNSPHAGVYLGDFEYNGHIVNVVECTGAWESKVQYTYIDEYGRRFRWKGGEKNKYGWTDYGWLPYVEDDSNAPSEPSNDILTPSTGIDVSRWQKGFDLNNAKKEGFTYAIIKAGGADAGYYKDSQFENFYNQAVNDGFKVGAYFFGQAFSVEAAIQEANYFINILNGHRIVHVYYDVEAKMLNQGYQHLTEIIAAFCNTLIAAGYACGIYTSESQFNSRFNDAAVAIFPHWVARYSSKPPTIKSGAPIEIWQYGGSTNYLRSAKIAGTTVDQNIIYINWVDPDSQPICATRYVKTVNKTIDELAQEVLANVWGTGSARKKNLTAAGYDYEAVQKKVNEVVGMRKVSGKTYIAQDNSIKILGKTIVKRGESLSIIAKRYNTTVEKLMKANPQIKNKNLIYVGQEITIA